MADLWVTDSLDELSIEELYRDADQIHIPIFQREYVWKNKELEDLFSDIELIESEVEKSQFLGAIVAYERPRDRTTVGRLKLLNIVDGQQRLLTLYIFVMVIVELMARYDKELAAEATQEFLLLPSRRGLDINTRMIPSFKDRKQFRILWDRLNSPGVLAADFGDNPPRPPAPSGSDDGGTLVKQYKRILKYLQQRLTSADSIKSSCVLDFGHCNISGIS